MEVQKTMEEQLQELNDLLAEAQSVLLRFPFQTTIRQNISTLKDRRRELKKQLEEQTNAA